MEEFLFVKKSVIYVIYRILDSRGRQKTEKYGRRLKNFFRPSKTWRQVSAHGTSEDNVTISQNIGPSS